MLFEIPEEFFVIDVESNGLYGQPFCVGAVKMNWGGRLLARMAWRCPIDEVPDEWVEKNVLPNIDHINETLSDVSELTKQFFEWYQFWLADSVASVPFFVDAGFPVDYGFLYQVGKKYWQDESPYPVHDICSILAALGLDPDLDRESFAAPLVGWTPSRMVKRDPAWDAEVSGLSLIRAVREYAKRQQ